MAEIVVGKQNVFTYTWAVAAGVGTLTVLGNSLYDLGKTDLIRVEDTTQNTTFGVSATTTFAQTKTAGIPSYVWTFTNLPAGTVTADILLVYLNTSLPLAQLDVLTYSASKI